MFLRLNFLYRIVSRFDKTFLKKIFLVSSYLWSKVKKCNWNNGSSKERPCKTTVVSIVSLCIILYHFVSLCIFLFHFVYCVYFYQFHVLYYFCLFLTNIGDLLRNIFKKNWLYDIHNSNSSISWRFASFNVVIVSLY